MAAYVARSVTTPEQRVPIVGSYDVVVAGAGLAGVCAATAAAIAGAKTAIVEAEPFAGGISTAAMEPSICNYFHNTRGERIVGGRPLELIQRMVDRTRESLSAAGVPDADAERILDGVKGISFNYFTAKDVVRHPLVARIIEAYDRDDGAAG